MNKILKKNNVGMVQVLVLVSVTFLAYIKLFHAPFAEWDDNEYVVHNKDIMGFGLQNIGLWLSKFYLGNYQPVTMLVYGIDYILGGLNPAYYHLTNLLFHIGNTIAVYVLIFRLGKNAWVAFFTALIFSLHPSQTESVSWVAESKTVICAFFYLLALIKYLDYRKAPSVGKMGIVLLFGVLSILSKGVGVALPLSLLAIDIWQGRELRDKKVWIEKIPLLIISLIFGIIAIKAQEAGKFIHMRPDVTYWDTLLNACYAYILYFVHLVVPYGISVIYPYPYVVGIYQYISLPIILGVFYLTYMAYKKNWTVLLGGLLFYSVNIVLVLQFISFGDALMADRYFYIAGIALIYIAVHYVFALIKSVNITQVVLGLLSCGLLVMTYIRNDIWLSDMNFYQAILDAYPRSAVAQYSVGGLYMREGKYAEAGEHINLAVLYEPGNYKAWYNKGALALRQGKPDESLEALNKCLEIKEYPKALFSRALLYQGTSRPDLALTDIEKVLLVQPQNARAWYIRGDCMEQQNNLALAMDNYNKALEYEPGEPLFYIRRGLLYAKNNQADIGLGDLEKAVSLNPRNAEAYYYRGIVKSRGGKNPCNDFSIALKRGYKPAQEAISKFCNQGNGPLLK